jgi:hypothetical protein
MQFATKVNVRAISRVRGFSTQPAMTQVYGGLKDQDRIFTNM